MRIAVLGLDSRPPNWQFPQRLAAAGNIESVLPPRERLGQLKQGADRPWLMDWLAGVSCGMQPVDAVVLSLDALLYGGLVQSRRLEAHPDLDALHSCLGSVDWQRVRGYAYITIPRLGLSVDSTGSAIQHEKVREYLITHARAQTGDEAAAGRLRQLENRIGRESIEWLWELRRRNYKLAMDCQSLCAALGFRSFHVAVEDNAPAGPHLAEAASLRQLGRVLRSGGARTEFSLFDGADECACLMLARAAADLQNAGPLPIRVAVHPAAPGPQNYRGMYETHTLAEGLDFLLGYLRLESRSEAAAVWLVCHGQQPQQDVFASDPERAFASPFLIPERIRGFDPGQQELFVTDLCACNGANPHLAIAMLKLAGPALKGLVGFNTNFNALGLTAALLSIYLRGPRGASCNAALRRFFIERLADDVVYQSLARPQLVSLLRELQLDPMNFSEATEAQLRGAAELLQQAWSSWANAVAEELTGAGHHPPYRMRIGFPWRRAFECEVEAA